MVISSLRSLSPLAYYLFYGYFKAAFADKKCGPSVRTEPKCGHRQKKTFLRTIQRFYTILCIFTKINFFQTFFFFQTKYIFLKRVVISLQRQEPQPEAGLGAATRWQLDSSDSVTVMRISACMGGEMNFF